MQRPQARASPSRLAPIPPLRRRCQVVPPGPSRASVPAANPAGHRDCGPPLFRARIVQCSLPRLLLGFRWRGCKPASGDKCMCACVWDCMGGFGCERACWGAFVSSFMRRVLGRWRACVLACLLACERVRACVCVHAACTHTLRARTRLNRACGVTLQRACPCRVLARAGVGSDSAQSELSAVKHGRLLPTVTGLDSDAETGT
jgi:hypothetical protein